MVVRFRFIVVLVALEKALNRGGLIRLWPPSSPRPSRTLTTHPLIASNTPVGKVMLLLLAPNIQLTNLTNVPQRAKVLDNPRFYDRSHRLFLTYRGNDRIFNGNPSSCVVPDHMNLL